MGFGLVQSCDQGKGFGQEDDQVGEHVPEKSAHLDGHIDPGPSQPLQGDDLQTGLPQGSVPNQFQAQIGQDLGHGLALGLGRLQTPQHHRRGDRDRFPRRQRRPGCCRAMAFDPAPAALGEGRPAGVELIQDSGPRADTSGAAKGVAAQTGRQVAAGQAVDPGRPVRGRVPADCQPAPDPGGPAPGPSASSSFSVQGFSIHNVGSRSTNRSD